MADIKVNSFNSTGGNIKIIEFDRKQEELEVQFVPAKAEYDMEAKTPALEVPNTLADYHHLTGSREKLNFDIEFFARNWQQENDVWRSVQWLRALTKPPKCRVIVDWGGMYDDTLWLLRKVKATPSLFMANDPNNPLAPRRAIVGLEFIMDFSKDITLDRLRR